VEIATQQLFKQDRVSCVYFKNGDHDMLSNLNNSNSKSNSQALLQNTYENPSILQDITSKWDKYFEEKENQRLKEDNSKLFHRLFVGI